MKSLHVLVLALGLGVAGCATAPGNVGGGGAQPVEASMGGSANARARIHTELAAGYYARGQYGIALSELNLVFQSDASYAPAYGVLALVRAELREDKLAEEAFRKAISLQPDFSEARNNFGHYLCQKGRTDEGLGYFESALKNPLYSTPEKALANAGACSLRKGDVDGAEGFLTRALRYAPDLPMAIQGMADVDFRQGRYLASRIKLQRLAERGDLSAQALWLGIRTERMLGDRSAEASYEAQLRRRFPDAMQTQWLIMGQYDQLGVH
jgi:type IV pilus assembly protein PilF